MSRFYVAGAAGHAQEVAWSLREARATVGLETKLVFFDDRVPAGLLPSGLGAVAGTLDDLAAGDVHDATLVLGIGLPGAKEAVVARLAVTGRPWATVIHPRATIGPNVTIGEGAYVAAGAIATLNVRIGRFATVNMHAQVAHDGVVGEFATLHPDAHLAGNVVVGDRCEIGTGASVIPGVRIAAGAVVGAGGVVVRSVERPGTWVGVPVRAVAPPKRKRA